ncbi:hypothetical protein [Pseudohoeflea coraliihabitans]|uniref:Uncharacterized protein n=1 Tax=Pseudohoeflea coraliihabitans TaxID=2860393 RepID=A0ABS6WKJ7_9HYPH|nr:hypothetical protein [Pseudohoeflea sp. DP4N28-3]MBW3096400.1 hypothetical protein [Pseudohoeflea sp. DP4N28-3]
MAKATYRLFAVFRMSRKLVLITGGVLMLLGASGTAALIVKGPFEAAFSQADIDYCETVHEARFTRGGERRLIAIIRTGSTSPEDRIRTGLRLAQHFAEVEQPDLVTLQLVALNGPENRAELRGPTIGTEIVYAANPNRTRATDRVWEVRYLDARPTELGFYFGPRRSLDEPAIAAALQEVETVHACGEEKVAAASD